MSSLPRIAFPFSADERYRVTQGYRTRYTHQGVSQYSVDFATPFDTAVQAIADGEVVAVERSVPDGAPRCLTAGDPSLGRSNIGNFITLKHSDSLYSSLLHLQQGSAALQVGDRVARGQVIARIGQTGWRTGAHMHLQLGGGLVSWKAGPLADGTKGAGPPALFEGLDGDPVEGTTYRGSPRHGPVITGARLPLHALSDPSRQSNRTAHREACERGAGRFPFTSDGWWHDGVHLHAGGDEQRRLLCAMFDGTVIACRLSMPSVEGRSANFLLLEHTVGRARFYTLYLHLEALTFPAHLEDDHPIRRHRLAWLERAYYRGGALIVPDLEELFARTKPLKAPVRVQAGEPLARMGVGFDGPRGAFGPAEPFCHLELFSLHAENAGGTIYRQLGLDVPKLVLRDPDADLLAEPGPPEAFPLANDPRRFDAVVALLGCARERDPATVDVFGATAGAEAPHLFPEELEALLAPAHREVLRDVIAQHVSTWAVVACPTSRATTPPPTNDPLIGNMAIFAEAGRGWEKFTSPRVYFYDPIRVVEHLSPPPADRSAPARPAGKPGTIVVRVVDADGPSVGVAHSVVIEALFDGRRFEQDLVRAGDAARAEYGLRNPFAAGRYRVTVTPWSPGDRVEDAAAGVAFARDVEVTGGPAEVSFQVRVGPIRWTCEHRHTLLPEAGALQLVASDGDPAGDGLSVHWHDGPATVLLVDEQSRERRTIQAEPGAGERRYAITVPRGEDEGWNLLDGRFWRVLASPTRYTLVGADRRLAVEVYSHHEYELEVSLPPMRGVSCGVKVPAGVTLPYVAPARPRVDVEVQDPGWRATASATPDGVDVKRKRRSLPAETGIVLRRDGAELELTPVKLFGDLLGLVRSISSILRTIQNAVPEAGWYADLDVRLFEGALRVGWGWREHVDHRVFRWARVQAEMTLFAVALEVGFGIDVGFAAQVFVQLDAELTFSGDIERVSPEGSSELTLSARLAPEGAVGVRFEVGSWIELEGRGSSGLDLDLSFHIGGNDAAPLRLEGEATWTGLEVTIGFAVGPEGYGSYRPKAWSLLEERSLGGFRWPAEATSPPTRDLSRAELADSLSRAVRRVRVFTGDDEWPTDRVVERLVDRIDAWPDLQRDEASVERLGDLVRLDLDRLGRRWLRDWVDGAAFEAYVRGGARGTLDDVLAVLTDPCAGLVAAGRPVAT